jgi:predicted nucleic acid-binding protein
MLRDIDGFWLEAAHRLQQSRAGEKWRAIVESARELTADAMSFDDAPAVALALKRAVKLSAAADVDLRAIA